MSEDGPGHACRCDPSSASELGLLTRRTPACSLCHFSLLSPSLSPLPPPPHPASPCPLLPHPSACAETEQADLRPQEPHLRLRHGLHHKRHADRGQPDPPERHGVGRPPPGCVPSSPRMRMPSGQTLFLRKSRYGCRPGTVGRRPPPKAAVQQVLPIHFISLAGTPKGCLKCFNGFVS